MKTIKVSEATGPALDWLVAKCEGWIAGDITHPKFCRVWRDEIRTPAIYPSTNWGQCGPIIYREKIGVYPSEAHKGMWVARNLTLAHIYGDTPLIAAMRCYVVSKLGDYVYIPDILEEKC